jgi:hypothetical protein
MSRELHSIGDCLDGLRELVKSGASGNFYLAGSDNNIAAITLNGGVIEAVNFKGRRGDFAVELLKGMETASCTFRADAPRPGRNSQLSNYAVRWLIGDAGTPAAATKAPAGAEAGDNTAIQKYRSAVESIAFAFLGPIAAAVCEGAFSDCASIREVLDELAANLPPGEAEQFRNEVAKAIGVK